MTDTPLHHEEYELVPDTELKMDNPDMLPSSEERDAAIASMLDSHWEIGPDGTIRPLGTLEEGEPLPEVDIPDDEDPW